MVSLSDILHNLSNEFYVCGLNSSEGFSYLTLLLLFSGVYGKVQLHSAYPKKSWTHLGADIASGNER